MALSQVGLERLNTATSKKIGTNKNLIINGAMQVAQRGTSFTSVTASAYHLDRFQYNLNGTVGAATVTQNTVTDLAGFTKSLKVDCTTADASLAASDRLTLRYAFEGQDLQQVAKGTSSAKQLTLSFYIKATKTGTQIVELFDHDNTRHCAKSVTISQSNTWEKKTITYPADTTGALDNDNANSISIFFGIACGTDFTSGTLATAWAANTNANRFVGQVNHFDNTANNFEITGVQLEVGSVATDFEFMSYGDDLLKCQRYYEHSYNTGVAVGANSNVGGYYQNLNSDNGVVVVINRNGTLFRMGIRSGYILTEINNVKIENTKDLKAFEREDIFQFTFVDLNGEKEKLVFD